MPHKNYPYYEHQKLKNFSELLDFCSQKYGDKIVFSYHNGEKLIKKSFYEFEADVRNLSNYYYENFKFNARIIYDDRKNI